MLNTKTVRLKNRFSKTVCFQHAGGASYFLAAKAPFPRQARRARPAPLHRAHCPAAASASNSKVVFRHVFRHVSRHASASHLRVMREHVLRHVFRHVFGHVLRHVFRHVFRHVLRCVLRHVLRHVYRHVYRHVLGHVWLDTCLDVPRHQTRAAPSQSPRWS